MKGHFSVILSEGASVCREGCPTVHRSGCDEENCRKGFGLSPKEDKSGLGCGKEVECSLTPPVDGSGVRHGKVDWCGGGQGRAEQQ